MRKALVFNVRQLLFFMWFCMSFGLSVGAEPLKQTMHALVFDTGIHPVELYQHPLDILKKLGWSVTYRSLEDSLGLGLETVFASKPRLSIFIISEEFFRAAKDSIVAQFVKDALVRSAALGGGTTVIMLPHLGTSREASARRVLPVFKALGLQSLIKSSDETRSDFSKVMTHFLANPFAKRKSGYHTALRMPSRMLGKAQKYAHAFLENNDKDLLCSFPTNFRSGSAADGRFAALNPMGTCFFSAERNHSFVVSYSSLMTTMGASEDIHILPFEVNAQKHLHELICNFWRDVDIWTRFAEKRTRQDFVDAVKGSSVIELSVPVAQNTAGSVRKKPVKTVWMELVVFDETGKETPTELARKRLLQGQLVASLLESGIEYAWISLSPQMYYGAHAKNPGKRAMFEAGFARFAKSLKAESVRKEMAAPKILVGFEIANNLYEQHLPKEFAVDLYGVAYPDIPSPCSKLFWKEEVVQPLEAFCSFFAKNKLHEFVTLGGVTIDVELYGRKDTGGFGSLMLCDPVIAEGFCKSMGLESAPGDFIAWVIREHKVQSLVEFASQKVRECAFSIKSAVQRLIPRASVSVYAPVVSLDWFLANFCKVFGSGEKKLQLFTFNTAFDRVRSVVERKFGARVSHGAVLMLSKFCGPQDYALLDRAMDANDGYWFNRWSRFAEPRDAELWHAIEQPGVDSAEDCLAFYSKIASH